MKLRTLIHRILVGALVTFAATGALTVAVPSAAASVAGGTITSSEVLSRAQHWVDQGYTYLNDWHRDTWRTGPTGAERYRRDCSGLVSMAWHLPEGDWDTGDFENWIGGSLTRLPNFDALAPGDAILRVNFNGLSNHMELFARWKNPANHGEGAYFYSFNGTGETVRNPSVPSNLGNLGFHSYSHIVDNYEHAVHYNMMTTGGSASLNGDNRADIVKKPGTTPGAFYNNGLTPNKGIYWDYPDSDGYPIGSGWDLANDAYYFADMNGDGRKDMIKKTPDHTLQAYYKTATGWDYPGAGGYVIGLGWDIPNDALYFADLNGDGRADIVKKTSDNQLQAYYNNGLTPDKGIYWDHPGAGGYVIGLGWDIPNDALYFADLNGDGRADIVKKTSDNQLQAYYNNGLTPDKGIYWDHPGAGGYVIGLGWDIPNDALYFADLNGDGRADIVKKTSDNQLQAYYNNGLTPDKGIYWDHPGAGGYVIGLGWDIPNNALYFV